jgi:hypothetical protein
MDQTDIVWPCFRYVPVPGLLMSHFYLNYRIGVYALVNKTNSCLVVCINDSMTVERQTNSMNVPESSRDKTQVYYLTTWPEGSRKESRFQSLLKGRDLEVCGRAAEVRS